MSSSTAPASPPTKSRSVPASYARDCGRVALDPHVAARRAATSLPGYFPARGWRDAEAVSHELLAPRAQRRRPPARATRAHRAAHASRHGARPDEWEAVVDAGLDRRRGK